jgi:glutamine amidotransferase-like uncharacterized protein
MLATIALFLHQPKCSVQSGNGIIQALSPYYRFKIFTRQAVEDDFFDDVDVVAVPGGIGDSESYRYVMREHESRIQQFVKQGGRYLGICMGAYWADQDYLGLTSGVRAVQYITRPNTDTRRPHPKNIAVTWQGQATNMYFYDGCALVGDETTFDVVARYSNGDPMAIIQNGVGLIGCHPESQQFWYQEHSWMRPHYHQGQHATLLLNFVDQLCGRDC